MTPTWQSADGAVRLFLGDCLAWMREQPDKCVDLVFGSPPYEDARTYGMDFKLQGEDWVAWMVEIVRESVRVSRGLAAFVIEGRTRKFRWSATPVMLMADLHRAGVHLRKPPIFHRVGIPGSGGPDWWRNDYEFVVCATIAGKLPWSDNIATGKAPKFAPGGAMSYRNVDGRRKNERTGKAKTLSQHARTNGEKGNLGYVPPVKANPGNVVTCKVGGGHMGHSLAAENEAPFPESLAESFVRCFCPPGGTVLDPFGGSGTVGAVAQRFGREAILVDIRESQIALMIERLSQPRLPGM
jgi:hypothetical protein